MTVELTGNYHYDKFGKNVYFTKGTINKNSIIIEAEGDQFFNFKLDEATLNKILELKTDSKNVSINGNWGDKFKHFPCVINSMSPLGGKLSEIYKYNISGEASYYYREYDFESKFEYDEDALYSPSMKVSYFDTNIEKIDIDTLKKYYERKFERRRL